MPPESATQDTRRTESSIETDTVAANQTPEEILAEFQEEAGLNVDLSTDATITSVDRDDFRVRIDRRITVKEQRGQTTISYPDYQSGSSRYIDYTDRYEKYPKQLSKLETLHQEEPGWANGTKTGRVSFRQKSGATPKRCGRCGGNGQKDCRDCNRNGQESCPRCSSSSASKSGHVDCTHCGGDGTVECSNCNRWGRVKNEDGEKVSCPKCSGDANWPCDHCGGDGMTRCPNHCDNGKITCRSCGGSQKVDCDQCGTSGKVVRVTSGEITYTFSEDVYANEDTKVDESFSLSLPVTCTDATGEMNDLPGADELQEPGSSKPRSSPYTLADISIELTTPIATIAYTVGGEDYEICKVGDTVFFDSLPTSDPELVRKVTIGMTALLLVGSTLLVAGDNIEALLLGVIA